MDVVEWQTLFKYMEITVMWNNFKQWTMLIILNLNLLQIGRIRVQGHNLCPSRTFSDAFASIIFWTYLRPFFFRTHLRPFFIRLSFEQHNFNLCTFVYKWHHRYDFGAFLFYNIWSLTRTCLWSYRMYVTLTGELFYLRESAHQKSGFLGIQRPAKRLWAQSWPISHRERFESTQRKHQSKFYLCVAMPPCTRHVDVMTFQEVG